MIKRLGSIMPFIFDLLYREYCRARLAEMRKQLLIREGVAICNTLPEGHEVLDGQKQDQQERGGDQEGRAENREAEEQPTHQDRLRTISGPAQRVMR
jgi:hypothetical protein